MKTTSLRNRSPKAIAGTALAVAISSPCLTHAADQPVWDKTFPKSEKVEHRKVSFTNRYGITLAADLYQPKELLIIAGANHTDLYDQLDKIPFDKLADFFTRHLR